MLLVGSLQSALRQLEKKEGQCENDGEFIYLVFVCPILCSVMRQPVNR